MAEKFPVQADGGDGPHRPAIANAPGKGELSESAGGAYPNPHDHETDKQSRSGGQTDFAYHGTGQLGEQAIPEQGNQNSPTRKDD